MSWTGALTDDGLALAEGVDTNLLGFAIGNGELTVTYMPEPTTLSVMTLASLWLMARRHRRQEARLCA